MATSRTGTTRWKTLRIEALALAQARGLVVCPCDAGCRHHPGGSCGVVLDYEVGRTPTSAEPDHIYPYANGGRDVLTNVRVICRRCNQARGSKVSSTPQITRPVRTTTTLVSW